MEVHTCIDTLRMKKHKAGFFNSEKYKYELHFLCTFGICTITHIHVFTKLQDNKKKKKYIFFFIITASCEN